MTLCTLPDGLDRLALHRIIAGALAEDIGSGDVTSTLTLGDSPGILDFVAREAMTLSGGFIPACVFAQLGNAAEVTVLQQECAAMEPGTVIARVIGPANMMLAGERVTLNLMQRMCGVATLTKRYVDAVAGTKAVILDTRKTMPGLRMIDKYAVRCGGGQNHRMRLDDMILIKDNHIAACGGIAAAVARARAESRLPVEVECDTLEQFDEALESMPDRIMLDNMDTQKLSEAVRRAAGKIPLEASGGVSLATVKAIAHTGVDYISVGALTHSAPAMDIGADLKPL